MFTRLKEMKKSQIMDFSDAILQINDTNEMHDQKCSC